MSVLIGIDPDVRKSGVACAIYGRIGNLYNLQFFALFKYLQDNKDCIKLVVIEAGWLNRSNWSIANRNQGQRNIQAKIAHDTGANHEAGKKIVEMCEYLGLKYELVKPTRSKVDHKTFVKMSGWTKRTNEEQRDAAMLVINRK